MKVNNVAKPLTSAQIFINIREFIPERNHTSIKNATKPLPGPLPLLYIREFIPEKNPTNVREVRKPAHILPAIRVILGNGDITVTTVKIPFRK